MSIAEQAAAIPPKRQRLLAAVGLDRDAKPVRTAVRATRSVLRRLS